MGALHMMQIGIPFARIEFVGADVNKLETGASGEE